MAGPKAVFVQEKDERWRLELRDLKAFRDVLGPDTVNAFCRCFVHADRLVSMAASVKASIEVHGGDSRAFERNLDTVFWFSIGTLRELSKSIQSLRAGLAKRGYLDPNAPPWAKLRELEDRWERDPFFRKVRDVASFHVDPEVIERGLGHLEANETAVLGEGDGKQMEHFSSRLGRDALMLGMGLDGVDLERFVRQISSDYYEAAGALSSAFVLALASAGIAQSDE